MTDKDATKPIAGWVCYDSECAFCLGWVRRTERALGRRGFEFIPLQTPWVKAYFDVGNIQLYGFPADWIRTLGKDRIAKVHLKDFHNRQNQIIRANVPSFVNLRDGDLDWKEIHKAFTEIGYKGYATVELKGGDEKYLRDVASRVDMILNGE